ncbi:MAG: aminoglycoside phosphotransferase family protein [Chloroflexota bacterium]|nr:aminoglycoside phosphotransferase family protein [Chloroflexota bacterium]
MERTLFATVDELLDPDALGVLGAVSVRNVHCVPLHPVEANSGSRFYLVETNDGTGPRYILKRISPAKDSAIGDSKDYLNRSVTLWRHGLLDRLPSEVVHAVVACSHDGAGYAILMHDVSAALMSGGGQFTLADHARFLDTMASMHAEFWEDPQLSDPRLGLRSRSYFFTDSQSGAEGWAFIEELLEPDVAEVVRTLLRDSRPIYDALMRYPSTLVHNDFWWANLGIVREEPSRVVLLDWDFATLAPPAVELAYYIGENSRLLPVSNEAVVEDYRSSLARRLGARRDEDWWLPQLDLGFLGCFLRRGKWMLLAASRAGSEKMHIESLHGLAWWSDQIRRGAQRL